MDYSETGLFTKEQERLAKNIARNIEKLRKTGCVIIAKQWELHAYLEDEFEHSEPFCNVANSDGYAIPYIECGHLNDSGADDTEYFERGYITGE